LSENIWQIQPLFRPGWNGTMAEFYRKNEKQARKVVLASLGAVEEIMEQEQALLEKDCK
jgi:hypothetical protein